MLEREDRRKPTTGEGEKKERDRGSSPCSEMKSHMMGYKKKRTLTEKGFPERG